MKTLTEYSKILKDPKRALVRLNDKIGLGLDPSTINNTDDIYMEDSHKCEYASSYKMVIDYRPIDNFLYVYFEEVA